MELRRGYKQTEVGVIPEDWNSPQIRSVCRLINGRGFKPHEWRTSGLPIVRIQNLNGSDEFNYYVGQYDSKILIENSQLLFAWSGSRGTSFGPHIWRGGRALLNYHTWKVAVDDTEVCQDYLYYSLRHLTAKIEDAAHGASALVHTQKGEMEQFRIAVPPTEAEQRAIATALSDVDALLGALDRLIAKKRDLKQAAMQQLLTGQTRLPGFSGEWAPTTLGSLGSTYGGLTGKSKADFGHGAGAFITFINVMANVVIDCSIFEPVRIFPGDAQNEVARGDLLFNGSSETPEEVALCSAVMDEVQGVYLNSFCFGFRFHAGVDADRLFFAYYLRSNIGRDMIKSLAQGSTRYNISKTSLLSTPLRLPSAAEQTAIATALSDMDAEIESLEVRRAKTRDLKQAMMQELLTGRTRLV